MLPEQFPLEPQAPDLPEEGRESKDTKAFDETAYAYKARRAVKAFIEAESAVAGLALDEEQYNNFTTRMEEFITELKKIVDPALRKEGMGSYADTEALAERLQSAHSFSLDISALFTGIGQGVLFDRSQPMVWLQRLCKRGLLPEKDITLYADLIWHLDHPGDAETVRRKLVATQEKNTTSSDQAYQNTLTALLEGLVRVPYRKNAEEQWLHHLIQQGILPSSEHNRALDFITAESW